MLTKQEIIKQTIRGVINDQCANAVKALDLTEEPLNDIKKEQLAAWLADFTTKAVSKYIKGQLEHGGNITDRDLIAEMGNEIIDQFFYLSALKQKLADENWKRVQMTALR